MPLPQAGWSSFSRNETPDSDLVPAGTHDSLEVRLPKANPGLRWQPKETPADAPQCGGQEQEKFLQMLWEVQGLVDQLHSQYHMVRQEFADTIHALRMENCKSRFHASSTTADGVEDCSTDFSDVTGRHEDRLGTFEDAIIFPPMTASCAPILAKEGGAYETGPPVAEWDAQSDGSADLKGLVRELRELHTAPVEQPAKTGAPCRPNLRIEIESKSLECIVDSSMTDEWTPKSSARSPCSGALNGDSERKAAIRRLQARLGVASDNATVTGGMLCRAVMATGVTKYDKEAMTDLIERLNNAPPRSFRQDRNRVAAAIRTSLSKVDVDRKTLGLQSSSSTIDSACESINSSTMSFHRFVNYLLDPQLRTYVSPDIYRTMKAIADVLLAGDANKIIAELTNARIDDLASPPPRATLLTALEPAVSFVIVLNCAWVALQLDSDSIAWSQRVLVDAAFLILFLVEVLLRVRLEGYDVFYTGRDWAWNILDSTIFVLAVFDLIAVATGSPIALRAIRLIRMLRIVRVIKRDERELTLVVRSFCGGFRALGWAVILLLGALFIFALYFRQMIGPWSGLPSDDGAQDAWAQFSTIPRSMFTILRCMAGDCTDSAGNSLTATLADKFGFRFMVAYFGAMLFLSCGLFSVIIAVYVEAALSAAKLIDEGNRLVRNREALRVAHTTKTLLKRFCCAAKAAAGQDVSTSDTDLTSTRRSWKALVMHSLSAEDVHAEELFRDHESASITKDIYMVAIQDKRVQQLMDDLDMPAERAQLFDALDASGAGRIQAMDLVSGLLQVRGHAQRSDVVGCKLVLNMVRDMVREMQHKSCGRDAAACAPPARLPRN